MTIRVFRGAAALVLALALQAVLAAHDIPDEIVVQSYVRPQQNQMQVLLRIPLLAISDANLPKDGTGYLAMAYLDPALREAANQISNGVMFLEGDERLTRYDLRHALISLPSDRSFDTYDGAIARVRGAKLPDATQVYYNQGFLDLELHYPIRSDQSLFSMRVLFGRGLANRTATLITFIRPDGDVRTFRIHDDTPLVRLDPQAHQAAWVFLKAGFYQFLDGLDHLLFVIVLALPFRRARDLVKPFVAFAVGHSITLSLAAFGLARMDTWFAPTIGALIALSLVYVAIENGVGAGLRRRWAVQHLPSACFTGWVLRSRCRNRCSSPGRTQSPHSRLQRRIARAGGTLSSWPLMDLLDAHGCALVACAYGSWPPRGSSRSAEAPEVPEKSIIDSRSRQSAVSVDSRVSKDPAMSYTSVALSRSPRSCPCVPSRRPLLRQTKCARLREGDGRPQPWLTRRRGCIGGNGVMRGKAAVTGNWKRFFDGPAAPSWSPAEVEVLPSGNLGFTSGVFDPKGNRIGTFNSVWQRQSNGSWKVVFDKCAVECGTK